MSRSYLTLREVSDRIKHELRTIRGCLKDHVLPEGARCIRRFGGRKILRLWSGDTAPWRSDSMRRQRPA